MKIKGNVKAVSVDDCLYRDALQKNIKVLDWKLMRNWQGQW